MTRDFETVSWNEFKALLSGIAPETPLGRIVAIRSETDKEIIKNFSPDQKRIYDDWKRYQATNMDAETYQKEMEQLEREMEKLIGVSSV